MGEMDRKERLYKRRRGATWHVQGRVGPRGRTVTRALRAPDGGAVYDEAQAEALRADLERRLALGEPVFARQRARAGALPAAEKTRLGLQGTLDLAIRRSPLGAAVEEYLEARRGALSDGAWRRNCARLRRFAAAYPGAPPASLTRAAVEDFLSQLIRKTPLPQRRRVRRGQSGRIYYSGPDQTRKSLVQTQRSLRLCDENSLVAPGTYNQYLFDLRGFFGWLLERKRVGTNPVAGLPLRELPRETPDFLTLEERQRILEAVADEEFGEEHALAPWILLECGLRWGELLRLTWNDVRLEAPGGPVLHVTQTKTGRSRQVPIPRALRMILENWRVWLTRCGCWRSYGPVLRGWRGSAVKGRLPGLLERLRRRSGVKRFSWLLCRHTYASLLLQQGTSPAKIAKWLGHARLETTLRYYGALVPGYDKDAELVGAGAPAGEGEKPHD